VLFEKRGADNPKFPERGVLVERDQRGHAKFILFVYTIQVHTVMQRHREVNTISSVKILKGQPPKIATATFLKCHVS
jgi:hypothetical protein